MSQHFSHTTRNRPFFGETVSGDGWVIADVEQGLLVVIIDALGHGYRAAELARQMESYINQHLSCDLTWLMTQVHEQFRGSIGAAVSMLYLDYSRQTLQGVAVGNTLIRKCNGHWQSFHAQPGVVGEMLPTLRPFEASLMPQDLIVLSTDGISENIRLSDSPALCYQSVDEIASFFIDNHGKHHDDATVIVVRYCHD